MLKTLFTFVLLSHGVLGRLTWNDRQLVDGAPQGTGNDWEYCKDACTKDCQECDVHHTCNDDEIKCGEGPTKVAPDGFELHLCAKDEICVSNKCSCPSKGNDNEYCGVVCECDCNLETEICCPQEDDANGCPVNPVCEPRHVNMQNEYCPGFCVEACHDDSLTCPTDPDPDTGCPHPDNCQPKQKDNSGDFCDEQQCILTCEYTQNLCVGETKHDGCKEDDICVPLQPLPEDPTMFCPGTCPVEYCQDGWIKCDGQVDYYGEHTKHCVGQAVCHVKAKNTNGVYCPDNSDSHNCLKTCPPDQILCPAQEGELGCKEETACSDRSTCDDGTFCPDDSDCPTVCPIHHVNCPGGVDDCGCKKPDLCIPEERDFNGDLCPVHCPNPCTDEDVFCPGQRNPITGCHEKDQCIYKETHQWGETPGELCPGWCPAICNEHEVLCPSMIDPCNGCPTEEICREAIKDKNGQFCPGKEHTVLVEGDNFRETGNRRGGFLSASHNCPVYCKEWEGETQCPVYEDALGCKPEASCVMRQKMDPFLVDVDGQLEQRFCPTTAVCEKQCPIGQKLCHYEENDNDGCHHEDVCIELARDKYGNLCDQTWCPPLCSGDQTQQDNGVDAFECPLAPTCV